MELVLKDCLAMSPEELKRLPDVFTFMIPQSFFSDLTPTGAFHKSFACSQLVGQLRRLGYKVEISALLGKDWPAEFDYRYDCKRKPQPTPKAPLDGAIDV